MQSCYRQCSAIILCISCMGNCCTLVMKPFPTGISSFSHLLLHTHSQWFTGENGDGGSPKYWDGGEASYCSSFCSSDSTVAIVLLSGFSEPLIDSIFVKFVSDFLLTLHKLCEEISSNGRCLGAHHKVSILMQTRPHGNIFSYKFDFHENDIMYVTHECHIPI